MINPLFNLRIITETPIISLQAVELLMVMPYLINYSRVIINWPCADNEMRLTR